MYDLIIIGAGAAGMMAALTAANIRVNNCAPKVLLLDGRKKIGAKILVSGGGRCNVTNEFVHPSRFHTESDPNHAAAFKGDGTRSFVGRVLRAFSQQSTLQFFEEIGVELKLEETGKYFPVSDSARTVLEALRGAINASGVQFETAVRVENIHKTPEGFTLYTSSGMLQTKAVILCTGGLALPKSGSDGAGFVWAKQFGHRIVFTTPALTPLLRERAPYSHLSGIAIPARLRFYDKKPIDYTGSLLFTHTGYSGPVALNISRHIARKKSGSAKLFLRLLPEIEDGEEGRFWQNFVRENSKKTLANALQKYFPRRLCETLSQIALGEPSSQITVGKLSSKHQTAVRSALLDQELAIDAVAPYVKAETTSGGVALDELQPATMMSKLQEGLFFAGEICDVDGWLGGYNFQWAWSSGTVAGRAAARWALRENEK